MPAPFDPRIFNHSMGAVGDASVISLTNEILNMIQEERGITITQEWRDAFYTIAIEAVITADPLWTGEAVATVILDALNEPYEGSPTRSGDPIYLPPKPPEQPGFPIEIRKPPVEEETLPSPKTPPERLPEPIFPGGISPPPVSPPRPPQERKPPVEVPPPLPRPLPSRLPEIPVKAPEPRGLSDEDRKKIDDLTKQLAEETKKLQDELKRLEDEQKKAAEAGKPAAGIDMAALAQIIFEAIDRWWRLAQVFPLHPRVEDEPENDMLRQTVIDESVRLFNDQRTGAKLIIKPVEPDIMVDYPFTL